MRFLRQNLFFIVCAVAPQIAFAEETYVQPLPEKTLSARLGITVPSTPLDIRSDSTSREFIYENNSAPKTGIGVDYKWLGFYVSLADLPHSRDTDTYGDTSYFDFQLHSYLGKWGFDFYFQHFEGAHIAIAPPEANEFGTIVRPDLKTAFLGFNVFYVFSPERMSLVASGNGTAIQLKSGGSWMLFGALNTQDIQSDSTLAPEGAEDDYGTIGRIQSANFKTLAAGGGYGRNWVLGGKVYLHLSAMAGIGPQWRHYSTLDNSEVVNWDAGLKGSARISLGYSGEKYFGAISSVVDSTAFRIDSVAVDFSSVYTFIYFGTRFEADLPFF